MNSCVAQHGQNANSLAGISDSKAIAPLQTPSGVWASIGFSGVVSGSNLAVHLRLALRNPAGPRIKYGSYFAADRQPLEWTC